jgi:hypothetical protein
VAGHFRHFAKPKVELKVREFVTETQRRGVAWFLGFYQVFSWFLANFTNFTNFTNVF